VEAHSMLIAIIQARLAFIDVCSAASAKGPMTARVARPKGAHAPAPVFADDTAPCQVAAQTRSSSSQSSDGTKAGGQGSPIKRPA
jgi:hypothetical protein